MAKESFEESIKKLETIVEKLEREALSLDESIRLFEEGVKLSQFCENKLEEAERKVEILMKERDGSFSKEPFAPKKLDEVKE